jgi:hypothetical protein
MRASPTWNRWAVFDLMTSAENVQTWPQSWSARSWPCRVCAYSQALTAVSTRSADVLTDHASAVA